MNKITTVLLGLLILFSTSCRLLKPSKDMGYDFVATLFNGEIGADGMRYFIKNLDGTMYNSNCITVDGGPSVDSASVRKYLSTTGRMSPTGSSARSLKRGSLSRSLSVTSGNS